MPVIQRLRIVYFVTLVVAGPMGMGMLIAPQIMGEFYNIGPQNNHFFGIVGSVWASFAVLSALGARCPLRFSPIVLLQLVYKVLWIVAILGPILLSGSIPTMIMGQALMFIVIILLDLWAMPWGYLFCRAEPDELEL